MKRVLQFSLLINVLLLALLAWRSTREKPILQPVRSKVQDPAQSSAKKRIRPHALSSGQATPWAAIEATDLRHFIANLRAIGCPEQTIRDIVTLRVCRACRNRVLEREADAGRNWDLRRNPDNRWWHERNEQRADLRDEMVSTLESLFGVTWQSLSSSLRGPPDWPRDPLESVSTETRRQVREVEQEFRHLMSELDTKALSGDLDREEISKLRELQRQKLDALAGVLSPRELEGFLYRQSPAADYVRRNLPAANSESEFRSMVKVALEMDMSQSLDSPGGSLGRLSADSAETKQEMEQRKAAFERRLKEVLGEARIAEQQAEEQGRAEFAKKQQTVRDDQNARNQMIEMAAEVGVGAEEAGRFFNRMKELKPILNAKFEEMEKGLTGTPEEKKKQMETAIKAELEKIAVETMGEQGRALIEKMAKSGK